MKTLKKSQYELIASAFQWQQTYNRKNEGAGPATAMAVGYQRVATQLADLFTLQDPKFDRQKWFKACEVEEDKLMPVRFFPEW